MKKVLVVDDDDLVNRTLVRALRSHGYKTDSACNAEEGLKKVARNIFDVVLCDIRIPGPLNGLDMANLIENSGKSRCILMSGYPKYYESLVKSELPFIDKPIDLNALLTTIEEAA